MIFAYPINSKAGAIADVLPVVEDAVVTNADQPHGQRDRSVPFHSTMSASVDRTCFQKQRSISQAVTDAQISSYCTCAGEKMAYGTTYKQLGTDPDASAIADLRQRTESIGYACR
jgi:hypothetical protein